MSLQEDAPASTPGAHHRTTSSLSDYTLLEIDFSSENKVQIKEEDITDKQVIPQDSLLIVAETEALKPGSDTVEHKLVQNLDELDFDDIVTEFNVKDWDGKLFYSDLISRGMKFVKREQEKVVMLFESPSSSSANSSFHNASKFKFHDWPPPKSTKSKEMLGPCRYGMMNGGSFPVFLRSGAPPVGIVDHWKDAVPGYVPSEFVSKITENETCYAYLPVEQIKNHVNDPHIHYHLAGKDSIHLMTNKTTRLLEDTRTVRPCVVKTTHSMGSKGIFIINDDKDDEEFQQFLKESGEPTFVVTDFVDIARNVACHFFMHPNGKSVTWFGSNENHREADGKFSSDSYLIMEHQKTLKELQLPFVEEVVKYCHGLGFWGFCGIDVLLDSQGNGFLVDINPRVTGSCPALMTLHKLSAKYGFQVGLFRRSGKNTYRGPAAELLAKVKAYNTENEGKSRIVIHSLVEYADKGYTKINIGVYGNSLGECKEVLNSFAKSIPVKNEPLEAGE